VVTAAVRIVTFNNDLPCSTVTVAGTGNAALLLVSATAAPPAGAGALSVMVSVAWLPPTRVAGLIVTAVNVGRTTGATVTFAILVTVRYVAEIAPVVEAETVVAVTFTLAAL